MAYLFLLAIQLMGLVFFVWEGMPEFRQIVTNPGVQLQKDIHADLLLVAVFFAMQISFWIRVRHVSIPFRRPNMFLNHVFLFFGRLGFIFGSALFSVVVFRHLPDLGPQTDVLLAVQRGIILAACLFALFCTSLELERLGQAFESRGP
jgi:ABC-type anion transport system duplicated permease subunit